MPKSAWSTSPSSSNSARVLRLILNLDALYGVLTKTLFMDGSMIDNTPLAWLCSNCIEQKEVVFLPQSG